METPHKKTIYLATLCVLFTCSAAMGYLLNEMYEQRGYLPEEPAVSAEIEPEKPRSFHWEERYELCEQYALSCEPVSLPGDEAVEAMLNDLSLSELLERYPMPDWTITENKDNVVSICRNQRGLCESHQHVYHFGLNESGQYLAVYFGPNEVGKDGGAFLVTDIPLEKLNAEQKQELDSGTYEFYSQDELISMLDNLSEL